MFTGHRRDVGAGKDSVRYDVASGRTDGGCGYNSRKAVERRKLCVLMDGGSSDREEEIESRY